MRVWVKKTYKPESISKLQEEWYLKLKEEGFDDIEVQFPTDQKPNFRPVLRNESSIIQCKSTKTQDWSYVVASYAHHMLAIGEITEQQSTVLINIADGKTYTETAELVGLTFAKVRYIVTIAMKHIKRDLMAYPRPSYLTDGDEDEG